MATTDELVPLVDPSELVGLRGGPFPPKDVLAAGATVRRLARWHIAPNVEETLVLDHDGGPVVFLPSKHVTDVLSVEALDGTSPRELPASSYRWSEAGMLQATTGAFPRGFRVLRITLRHGYLECPEDLLPVVASRAKRAAVQESIGSRSVTYEPSMLGVEQVILSYRIGNQP